MSGGYLRGSISCPGKFKRGISLLYRGCYRSNHGINIFVPRHVICNLRNWSKSVGYGRITHTF